ncbi:uncharacterized protein LOC110450349 [Mizuhopecten yessoensis]|uniref:uncharacterized protein LOC110450349 n=1 Tax=Mizuhopecten yessoensis TaxID=6573 RepID=UPI000B458F2B|nr:uncharacterized protein LOC110450349 [Mizuhopecten yessoensis]
MGAYTIFVTFLVFLVIIQYITALRCLSCNGFIQPHQCSNIELCPEGDVCITESYRSENGETMFYVGCASAKRCALTSGHKRFADILRTDNIGTPPHRICTECCHSDLCNSAGCRMGGFPTQRGPVCLDCPQSRDLADCDAISICQQSEVCYVEEMFEFGELFYKTSCLPNTEKRCVSPTYNPVEVGKRSHQLGTCFSCCPYDLCNSKCDPFSSSVLTTIPATTPTPITHSFNGKSFFLMFIRNHNNGFNTQHLSVNVTFLAKYANIEVITRYNAT